MKGVLQMSSKPSTDAVPALSRLDRARIVRDEVLAVARQHGSWEEVQVGAASEGRSARSWRIDPGQGWSASVDTPFNLPPSVPSQADIDRSAASGIEIPSLPDRLVDVYWNDFGKVLSISDRDGEDRLVGFEPGPWEAAFGLPDRPWSPAAARRIARRDALKAA